MPSATLGWTAVISAAPSGLRELDCHVARIVWMVEVVVEEVAATTTGTSVENDFENSPIKTNSTNICRSIVLVLSHVLFVTKLDFVPVPMPSNTWRVDTVPVVLVKTMPDNRSTNSLRLKSV